MSVKIGHSSQVLVELSQAEKFQFKEIDGHGGYYITTDGRVWGKRKRGFLTPSIVAGYLRVSLCKNGSVQNYHLHRLVAQTFIPNPNSLPTVNHKDENKLNNRVENLEWCSQADNNRYGTRTERMALNQLNRKDSSKAVVQLDKKNNVIAVYPSSKEAWRQTGIHHGHIREVCSCKEKHKTAGGYKWKWAEEDERGVC